MLLILAEPVEPPQNVDFVKAMMVGQYEGTIESAHVQMARDRLGWRTGAGGPSSADDT